MAEEDSGAGRRVCVTGASGFIAGHIVAQLLDKGYEVSAYIGRHRFHEHWDGGRLGPPVGCGLLLTFAPGGGYRTESGKCRGGGLPAQLAWSCRAVEAGRG